MHYEMRPYFFLFLFLQYDVVTIATSQYICKAVCLRLKCEIIISRSLIFNQQGKVSEYTNYMSANIIQATAAKISIFLKNVYC